MLPCPAEIEEHDRGVAEDEQAAEDDAEDGAGAGADYGRVGGVDASGHQDRKAYALKVVVYRIFLLYKLLHSYK